MLHLLKGKCCDKSRQYKNAVNEYSKAIELGLEHNTEEEILGQLYFRLGWSLIRSKQNIEIGVDHLKKANKMLPDNTEVMVKLSGVLFQEIGTDEDIQNANVILTRLVELDPNNAEAFLLQGKINHKLSQWAESITSLEKAVQIQAEDGL